MGEVLQGDRQPAHKRGVTRSPQAPSSPCHATELTDFRQPLITRTEARRFTPDSCLRAMRKHRSLLDGVKLRYPEILFPTSSLYFHNGLCERFVRYVGFFRQLFTAPVSGASSSDQQVAERKPTIDHHERRLRVARLFVRETLTQENLHHDVITQISIALSVWRDCRSGTRHNAGCSAFRVGCRAARPDSG